MFILCQLNLQYNNTKSTRCKREFSSYKMKTIVCGIYVNNKEDDQEILIDYKY